MTSKLASIFVLACLMTATGCKKDQGSDEMPEDVVVIAGQDPSAQAPEDPIVPPPAPQVDESLFIKAYFEVTCVQAHIDDPTLQTRIIEEIRARYGFDSEAAYRAAEAEVAEKPNIKFALESRMKACTKPMAESFEKAGAMVVAPPATDDPVQEQGGEQDQEKAADLDPALDVQQAEEPAAPAEPATPEAPTEQPQEEAKTPKTPDPPGPTLSYKPGPYVDNNVREMSITGGRLSLTLTEGGKISGRFSGSRDGKSFSYSVGGTITKRGTMSGQAGSLRFKGQANRTIASGVFTGIIHGKRFSTAFKANR